MQNTKINYGKMFGFIFLSLFLYGLYSGFGSIIMYFTVKEEVSYLSEINKNYFYDKNIFEKSDDYFERDLDKSETQLIVSYKNINSNFCEKVLESIEKQEQVWTQINFEKNSKSSKIFMSDINEESINFVCSDYMNLLLIVDRESNEFVKSYEKIKEQEVLKLETLKITNELEFILTNIYNFQSDKLAVDSQNNPYNRVFGFLVQNNSKKIEDRKKMIITYQSMPLELCERFINITYNHESDEFHQQTIRSFDRDKLSVLINGENIKDLSVYKVKQLCFKDSTIRIETE